jgi:hypothetical protein
LNVLKISKMTSKEFNKTDNTFFLIEEKTKKVCKENNVRYYNYLSTFRFLLKDYIRLKKQIEVVKNLDFNNFTLTRATLNKASFSSKEVELNLSIKNFELTKDKLFNWLDNTQTPYFFILNPIYFFGSGIDYNSYFCKSFGYKTENDLGTKNLDVAIDYAFYRINNQRIK